MYGHHESKREKAKRELQTMKDAVKNLWDSFFGIGWNDPRRDNLTGFEAAGLAKRVKWLERDTKNIMEETIRALNALAEYLGIELTEVHEVPAEPKKYKYVKKGKKNNVKKTS